MAKESRKAEGVGRELSPDEVAEYNRYQALGRPAPDKFDNVVVENVGGNFVMRYKTDEEVKAQTEAHEAAMKVAAEEQEALDKVRAEVGPERLPPGPVGYGGGANGPGTQPGRGAETVPTTNG